MHVTYHIGLHCTDEDRALTCLLRNRERLADEGCAVPRPGLFRPALREAMLSLKGEPAPPALQQSMLDAVVDIENPRHVLFSSDSFLCIPQRAIGGDQLYPLAAERAPWIRQLFPDATVQVCFALRNPATLIPALFARSGGDQPFDAFLETMRPEALLWSDMVARLGRALPDTRLLVWCHEDAPVLWPELLARLAGRRRDSADDLPGWDAFLGELLPAPALEKLRGYLADHPPREAAHRRRVLAAFLDRFAKPEAVEEEFDLPGWDQRRVDALTARYEEDLLRIERIPGVEFLVA